MKYLVKCDGRTKFQSLDSDKEAAAHAREEFAKYAASGAFANVELASQRAPWLSPVTLERRAH